MKTNWSRFMYLFSFTYIIIISTLMLYTINIESIKIGIIDKYLENKEMSLLDALLLSSDLGGYKKWLLLCGVLIVAVILDRIFTIPMIYYNWTKAGKIEKWETKEKFIEINDKIKAKKLSKKLKKIEKEEGKYE